MFVDPTGLATKNSTVNRICKALAESAKRAKGRAKVITYGCFMLCTALFGDEAEPNPNKQPRNPRPPYETEEPLDPPPKSTPKGPPEP